MRTLLLDRALLLPSAVRCLCGAASENATSHCNNRRNRGSFAIYLCIRRKGRVPGYCDPIANRCIRGNGEAGIIPALCGDKMQVALPREVGCTGSRSALGSRRPFAGR